MRSKILLNILIIILSFYPAASCKVADQYITEKSYHRLYESFLVYIFKYFLNPCLHFITLFPKTQKIIAFSVITSFVYFDRLPSDNVHPRSCFYPLEKRRQFHTKQAFATKRKTIWFSLKLRKHSGNNWCTLSSLQHSSSFALV